MARADLTKLAELAANPELTDLAAAELSELTEADLAELTDLTSQAHLDTDLTNYGWIQEVELAPQADLTNLANLTYLPDLTNLTNLADLTKRLADLPELTELAHGIDRNERTHLAHAADLTIRHANLGWPAISADVAAHQRQARRRRNHVDLRTNAELSELSNLSDLAELPDRRTYVAEVGIEDAVAIADARNEIYPRVDDPRGGGKLLERHEAAKSFLLCGTRYRLSGRHSRRP